LGLKPKDDSSGMGFALCAMWYTPERTAGSRKKAFTRPAPVGVMLKSFTDEARRNWTGTSHRPLATIVWYPVDSEPK